MTVRLYYCYSDVDDGERQEIAKHLQGPRQEGLKEWHRGLRQTGDESEECRRQLDNSDLIVVLSSPDFDHYGNEAERALSRHQEGMAQVIPVLVRRVDAGPFEKLQFLPRSGTPISAWGDRDQARWEVGAEIKKAFKEVRQRRANGVSLEIRLDGEMQKITPSRLAQIEEVLRGLFADNGVRVVAVMQGSIRLILRSSWDGFRRFRAAVLTKQVEEVDGLPVREVILLRSLLGVLVLVWIKMLAGLLGKTQIATFTGTSSSAVLAKTVFGAAVLAATLWGGAKVLLPRQTPSPNLGDMGSRTRPLGNGLINPGGVPGASSVEPSPVTPPMFVSPVGPGCYLPLPLYVAEGRTIACMQPSTDSLLRGVYGPWSIGPGDRRPQRISVSATLPVAPVAASRGDGFLQLVVDPPIAKRVEASLVCEGGRRIVGGLLRARSGTHVVKVWAQGYLPVSASVQFVARQTIKKYVSLTPCTGPMCPNDTRSSTGGVNSK